MFGRCWTAWAGYVENLYEYGDVESGDTRTASLSMRVPSENLDAFLDGMEGVGRVTDRSESVTDMTVQYTDNQTRLETLYAKRERLNQLMAQAQEVSDLIELETAVADTQYEIERYETSQRDIDRRVDMSAVNVTLLEESPAQSATAEDNGLGERLGAALRASLRWLGGFLRNMLVFVTMILPVAVPVAAIAAVVMAGCAQTVPARPEGWFQGGMTHERLPMLLLGRTDADPVFRPSGNAGFHSGANPCFHSGGRSHGRPGNHHPCHGHGEWCRCRRDIVVLTLCVQGSGDTVTAAQDKAEQVIAKASGMRLRRWASPNMTHRPPTMAWETVYNYQYSKLGQQETASGYTVSIDLAVRLDDPARVGEVIDAAICTGAQNSYELAYESSEARDAYFEALGAATADAMAQAILLAEASGLELGRLVSVTEVQGDESTVSWPRVSARKTPCTRICP